MWTVRSGAGSGSVREQALDGGDRKPGREFAERGEKAGGAGEWSEGREAEAASGVGGGVPWVDLWRWTVEHVFVRGRGGASRRVTKALRAAR